MDGFVGKFVKTVDGDIDTTGVLSFIYPNFIIRDEVYYDNDYDVLYTGKIYNGLRKELESNTKNYICVCNFGMYDIDFTSRKCALDLLTEKWNKPFKEHTVDLLEGLSEHDFWDYFKNFWVVGKSKIDESDISLWDLYKVLGKQRHDILEVYFNLKKFYSNSFIFTGLLSFIEKSLNIEDVSTQNGRYLKMLQDFNKEYSNKVIPIIQRVYVMEGTSDIDKEYRTMWLLMQLGKGNII